MILEIKMLVPAKLMEKDKYYVLINMHKLIQFKKKLLSQKLILKDKYQENKKNYQINYHKLNKKMLKFKEMINYK